MPRTPHECHNLRSGPEDVCYGRTKGVGGIAKNSENRGCSGEMSGKIGRGGRVSDTGRGLETGES